MTGVVLALAGAPLAAWWLFALGQGSEAYGAFQDCLGGLLATIVFLGIVFSLGFHFFNGIRHLVWDTGRALDLKSVYIGGWLVVAFSVIVTTVIAWVIL